MEGTSAKRNIPNINGGQLLRLLIIGAKSAKLFKIAKAAKILKLSKVLITFFTMSLSAFVYAFLLGPWFSIGLVLMLFIHEMGHVVALRMKGIKASPPIFIPMLGAVVFSPTFKERKDEAWIGFSGPLVGSIAAALLFGVWLLIPHTTKLSELLLVISYVAVFLNIFNLLPMRPLDGGRTTQVVGGWFKYLGFAALLAFTFFLQEPVILLIWIIVLQDIKMNASLRFYLGVILQISMMLLMFMGFSSQPLWVDILDVVLATLMNVMLFATTKDSSVQEDDEQRPQEPIQTRIKWFILYVGLLSALIALMLIQIPHLPQGNGG